MSERNQVAAAQTALVNSIDWDKVELQGLIKAGNRGQLGGPVTSWLANQEWKQAYLKRLFEGEVITTGDTKVAIYELVVNATYQQIFESLGKKHRCWKHEGEALAFSRKNEDKLGPNGNFFKLKAGVVADVRLDEDGPPFVDYIDPLSCDKIWLATSRHHVFYPQQ